MNGIEKITGRIEAEAKAAAEALLADADRQAAAVRAEYEKKANAAYETRLSAGRDELSQRTAREERALRLDAKKDVLGMKQEMLAAAYAEARKQLLGMDTDAYVDFLAKKIDAAAVSGREELIFSESDRARVGEAVLAKANALLAQRGKTPALSLGATRPISGGVVLK